MRGFGFTFDTQTGAVRNWFVGPDGIKRWADNGQPADPAPAHPQESIGANQEGGGMSDELRRLFEAHRSDFGESPGLIRRDGEGYAIMEVDRDWRAWQACAEALALVEPLKNAARYLLLRSTKAAAFKTPFIGYRTFDGFSHFREDFADEQVDEAMEKAALTRTERMNDYRGESALPQYNEVKWACEAADVSQEAWNRLRYYVAERK